MHDVPSKDLPGINWLAHVLADNVGKNEWVPRNEEEQEKHRKQMKEWGLPKKEQEYPYKVITHPLPEGVDLKFSCDRDYLISLNCITLRPLLIGLAKLYEYHSREHHRLLAEARPWYPTTEWPSYPHSAHRKIRVQVDSPALHYISSFNTGYHDYTDDTWRVYFGDTAVLHKVERWRPLPDSCPDISRPYDEVKEECERLRELGRRPKPQESK